MSAASKHLAATADEITSVHPRAIVAIAVVAFAFAAAVLLASIRPGRRENELSAGAAVGLSTALFVPGLLDAGPVLFLPDVFP